MTSAERSVGVPSHVRLFRVPARACLLGVPAHAWLSFCLLVAVALGGFALPAFAEENEKKEDPPAYKGDPETSAEHFDEGEAMREEGHWAKAADAYWKAVQADLNHYRAHVRYQEASLAAGDAIADLRDDYSTYVEDHPRNVKVKLHVLRLDDDLDSRLKRLEALKKAHATDFDVALEIGRVQLARGEPKAALAALEKAVKLAPASRPDILLMAAEAEWALDKRDAARTRLENAVRAKPAFWLGHLMLARFELADGQFEKAAGRAMTVIAQRPTYVAAFLIRAEGLAGTGKVDEAKTLLSRAHKINPKITSVAVAIADLVAKAETAKSYEAAVAWYQKALEVDDEDLHALYGMAWVLERQEKFEEAEEKYRQFVAIDPESVDGINSVGYCLLKQGRVSEAQRQFKRALDLDKDYVTAKANLGSTYDAQTKYGEAIKIYESILKTKGQKDNLRALINCAFDYEALGSFPKAAKLLLRAHEVLPEDPHIMVWVGDNMYFQKKWKDAEAWYQKAIAQDEKSFFAWRGLGLALGERKRWADAVNALARASKLKPDDLDLYLILGDLYREELKDLENALKYYQEYVQRGGDNPDVPDVIIEIQKEMEKKK